MNWGIFKVGLPIPFPYELLISAVMLMWTFPGVPHPFYLRGWHKTAFRKGWWANEWATTRFKMILLFIRIQCPEDTECGIMSLILNTWFLSHMAMDIKGFSILWKDKMLHRKEHDRLIASPSSEPLKWHEMEQRETEDHSFTWCPTHIVWDPNLC